MWTLPVVFRPARVVVLAVVGGLIALGLIYGPWIAAQARTVGVLTTAYDTPGITVSEAFSSTQSRPRFGGHGDVIRIDALFVRALRAIRNG